MTMEQKAQSWPEIIAILAGRYGDRSNAALMGRLSWLLNLLADDDAKSEEWELLRDRIVEHYTLDRPVQSTVTDFITTTRCSDGATLYQFSASEYFRRYASDTHATEVQTTLLEDRSQVLDLADQNWRLFVVTVQDELVVHSQSMDVTELIMNRNDHDTEVPLVHPTLVRDRGFAVKAAGEIAFTRTGTGRLGAVFNTKSGHFCPAPESAAIVTKALRTVVQPDRIVSIPVRLRIPADIEARA